VNLMPFQMIVKTGRKLSETPNLDDYEKPIMNLLEEMVDSNLLKPKDYEIYFSKFLIEAKQELKKQVIAENKTPTMPDNFWKGQEKYGLSGSIVAFIDKKYGRDKLFDLLKQTNKEAALKLLSISEAQLLIDWKNPFQ